MVLVAVWAFAHYQVAYVVEMRESFAILEIFVASTSCESHRVHGEDLCHGFVQLASSALQLRRFCLRWLFLFVILN